MMINVIVPLVYSLLIGKDVNNGNLSFEKVVEQDNFLLKPIRSDFETSTVKSVRETLPNAFHKR